MDSDTFTEKRQWFVITSSLLLLSWFIANAVPFFGNLMGIIGATTTAPLTFGVPALLVWIAAKAPDQDQSVGGQRFVHTFEWPLLIFLMCLSIFLCTMGLYANTIDLLEAWQNMGRPFSCIISSHQSPC